MRKLFLILAVILTLSIAVVGVQAAEQKETVGVPYAEIPFQVNPLYEGLVDPADFVAQAEEETVGEDTLSHAQPAFNSSKATYVSAEKAAQQVRSYLKERTESIDLYIKGSDSDYKALIEEVLNNAMEHTGKSTEGDYLMWHFAGWSGSVERDPFQNGYMYHYSLKIFYYTSAEQERELDAAISQLLKSLNLSKKSNYEKVCAVYDYISQNITYDYENLNDTSYTLKYSAYAALVNNSAVCQGYANLLYRLLLELGIDCRIITGETMEGPHAWNIIQMGDVYYNADATWDAILGDRSYFLKNSMGFADHYRYTEYLTIQFNRDYPMSATDYVDGVAGEPEHIFVGGMCGEDAYWTLDRDLLLTIYGTGEIDNYGAFDSPWHMCGTEIKNIIVAEGITRIGNYNFHDLPDLVSVSLPDSLIGIGSSAFSRCKSLTQIDIPDRVEYIIGSFQDCERLKRVTLGDSLRSISAYTFAGCVALEEIHFPDSLLAINSTAFDECNSLKEVTIPENVNSLAGFRYCENLETAYIHAKRIDSYAFYYCPKLKKVVLYDTVEVVNNSAFEGCDAIEELTVPASVVEFGVNSCDKLQTIKFVGSAPAFNPYSFEAIKATVYYPDNDPTWTEEVRQQYYGQITWTPYTPETPDDPDVPPTGILGDVSGDGILDSFDATLILQYDVGMISGETIQLHLADVSGDGILDSFDATLILQYDVGMIPGFPAA